jgi:thiamine kinase-like enzyme
LRTIALAHAPLTVQPGGLSNHAWMCEAHGEKYFVRLSPPDSDRLGVDRAGECALLQTVSGMDLAPEVIRCDPSQRLLVTRYIDGHALARDAAVEPHTVERLAVALRALHAQPVPAGMRRVDFAAQAAHLERQCGEGAAAGNELRVKARSAFDTLARAGRRDTLCHNDLHHLNLIDDGERLWLVDWEYGGAGDPVFDFASFLCQHDSGPREREILRQAYGGNGALMAEQLMAACWAFDYVQWLWYRAWPGGERADPLYASRAAAIRQRLLNQ